MSGHYTFDESAALLGSAAGIIRFYAGKSSGLVLFSAQKGDGPLFCFAKMGQSPFCSLSARQE
jgi:hypothetical protein